MSLFSRIKQHAFNEFIEIIEWVDDTSDTMIWRFPRYKAEIKNGAQLIVGETQVAVLVNEGQFADVFQPGHYELITSNMPILATLKGWKHGFNSPFKVEVYFVNTKQFLNLRWGTANPIMMLDPEFGAIRLRAFGLYSFRVAGNPIKFIRNVAGTDGDFTPNSVKEELQNFVINKFTDYLNQSKIAVLDFAANLSEFASELTLALKDDFLAYGIELAKLLIENISLPKTVEVALDKRTSTGDIDNMTTYSRMQFADSLKAAANNPTSDGSLVGDAIDAGVGLTMVGKMTQEVVNSHGSQYAVSQPNSLVDSNLQPTGPPPIPVQEMYYVAVGGVQQGPFAMAQLQQMVQQKQLTPESLVWTAGMANWAAASSVPSLSQLFGAVPPPI